LRISELCLRKETLHKKISELTKWNCISVEMLSFCERQLRHKQTDNEIVPECPFSGRHNCNPEICILQTREQIREQTEMGSNRAKVCAWNLRLPLCQSLSRELGPLYTWGRIEGRPQLSKFWANRIIQFHQIGSKGFI